jgi:DNA-binding XRE family transcriptional regulator
MRKESIEKAEKALAFIENGLTQKEACRKAGLSQMTYCNYKKNKKSTSLKVKNKVAPTKDLFMIPQHITDDTPDMLDKFVIQQLREENSTLRMFIREII